MMVLLPDIEGRIHMHLNRVVASSHPRLKSQTYDRAMCVRHKRLLVLA
jgi:hypothetical protein